MARPLLLSSSSSSYSSYSMPIITLLFIVLSIFSIFCFTTFLCGTKNRKNKLKKLKAPPTEEESRTRTSSSNNKHKLIKKLNTSLSNRAISVVKMLSWRKVQVEEEEEEEEHEMRYYSSDHDEEALWRKTILMGEKCRPIDFDGNIEHHFDGNILPYSSSNQNGHH